MALDNPLFQRLLFLLKALRTVLAVFDFLADQLYFPVAVFNFLLQRFQTLFVFLFDLPVFKGAVLAT